MKILRNSQVMETTGLSRTTIWRLERGGEFPKRVQLSTNSVGWLENEVYEWLEQRKRGMATTPDAALKVRMANERSSQNIC